MRNCKLQLTERFPRNVSSWNVPAFYIRSSLDVARMQSLPPPKHYAGVRIALLSSSAVKSCLQKGRPRLTFPKNILSPTKAHIRLTLGTAESILLSVLLVPTHLVICSTSYYIISTYKTLCIMVPHILNR